MKNITHVLTNPQDLSEERQEQARKNIGIGDYVEGAEVDGRSLVLTTKDGETVTFTDTGEPNVIEGVSVDGAPIAPVDKVVDIRLADRFAAKQDKLVAGENITIDPATNKISAAGSIETISVNGGTPVGPTNRNVNLEIADVPTPAAADEGKVLMAGDNGSYSWESTGSVLPTSDEDNSMLFCDRAGDESSMRWVRWNTVTIEE